MTMPRFQTHTVESFLEWWEGREGRYELHQGAIIEMSPPAPYHQRVIALLTHLLYLYVSRSRRGSVIPGCGVKVSDNSYLVPDLGLAAGEQPLPHYGMEEAQPSIVIEVLSPSTRRFDLGQKRKFYAQAGIPEYWIVDPEAQAFTFLRLADGAYGESALVGSIYETPLLPGFSLNTATFWEDVR